MHIAIRPHIVSTYNDTISIMERTPNSHIQHYFCHRHDAQERIYLCILFSQQGFALLHIAIRPHILSTYNDTISIMESTPNSHIQHYFCHRHDAKERIYLCILFSQHCCNSCSFLLFPSFCFEYYFLFFVSRYHCQSPLFPISPFV